MLTIWTVADATVVARTADPDATDPIEKAATRMTPAAPARRRR
jgi:hypothetical protein